MEKEKIKEFVGVKTLSFNKKLMEIHENEIEILAKYGININEEDATCFNCGADKLNFFYSKNTKKISNEERGYLKCKCFSCDFTGDVIDIAKKLDKTLKDKRTGEVVNYLLSEEFKNKPILINPNYEYTNEKKVKLKKSEETTYKTYYYVINDYISNFKHKRPPAINNYLYERGFTDEDIRYMIGFLGYEYWKSEKTGTVYHNLIFECSHFSFIRRLTQPYYKIKKDNTKKLVRYMNSKNLERTEHHCYLLEMIKANRIINNNFFNIFVCEGVFDALTVRVALQNKCLAFATSGANSTQELIADRLIKVAEEVYNLTNKKINVILLFDNDNAGAKGELKLTDLLENKYINLHSEFKNILGESKDINEEFKKNRVKFIYNLDKINKTLN